RKDTQVPQPSSPTNVADEAVNKEMDDSLVRAATTASSLEAEQDSGNIAKTQSKATLNEPSSIGTSSGSGPRRQETMGDTIAQTRSENVSKHSNDPLLAGVNTPRSGEDRLKLKELMELCTTLQSRVLALETTKTNQALEIDSLKRRVKKLEKKDSKRTHKLKRLYKVGLSAKIVSSDDEGLGEEDASKQRRKIYDIDADEDITLASTHFDAVIDMFGVHDLDGDEVFVKNVDASVVKKVEQSEKVVETEDAAAKDVNLSVDEVSLAQALAALKSAKPKATTTPTQTNAATTITPTSTRPKAKGIVFHDQEQSPIPTVSGQQPSHVKVQDKGKGIMIEEPLKMKKKDQISFDQQEAMRLQAEFDEEGRL
ncbi:hypothetical protein Tco_0056813, partial [Tanacetum coccineum]